METTRGEVGPEEVEVDEDIIEVGRAQGRAVKGEDTLYVRGILDGPADQRTLCAAVFDGHGGKAASAAALKTVGDRLMDHGPPFSDALIASQHGTRINSLAHHAPPACSGLPTPGPERRASRESPRRSPLSAETATALRYRSKAADVALPLTISRPTPSGRLIRHRAGSTCPATSAYMRSIVARHLCISLDRVASHARPLVRAGLWRGPSIGSRPATSPGAALSSLSHACVCVMCTLDGPHLLPHYHRRWVRRERCRAPPRRSASSSRATARWRASGHVP